MSTPHLGQRRTPQRETIFRVIRDAAGPLTIQEILEGAQQTLPGMGIATVYRTLNLLQVAGRIEVVILPSGESRYESSNLGHHHHFQCRSSLPARVVAAVKRNYDRPGHLGSVISCPYIVLDKR